jgi:hypothetical protein
MRSEDLVSSFGEIARAKDIDRDTLQIIVEDVFRAMLRKRYGSDEAFEIIFNPEQGDIQILHIQEVVGDWDLVDPVTEITVSEAHKIDESFDVGDEVASELDIADFGRRAVRRMNEVGMDIDCAHSSDRTTLDVVETSSEPIFLTHTGARALWDIKRLAPDEVIEAGSIKASIRSSSVRVSVVSNCIRGVFYHPCSGRSMRSVALANSIDPSTSNASHTAYHRRSMERPGTRPAKPGAIGPGIRIRTDPCGPG